MSLRPPASLSPASLAEAGYDALGHEILAEKAASLGRAGRKAEDVLNRLRAHEGDDEARRLLLKEAADAVYAWFVQRELCGFRRHHDVIRDYAIPDAVLVRLGAR